MLARYIGEDMDVQKFEYLLQVLLIDNVFK